jgi:glycosyltransferase involved in cell wall biosynthesis
VSQGIALQGCLERQEKLASNEMLEITSPRTNADQHVASPRLSVVVPVYNGAMHLSRCLDSLRLSNHSDFEVIVVDDCSTDGSRQIAERSGARCIAAPHTLGPAGARNLGVTHAQGEIFVFVDADVEVPRNALDLIEKDFADDAQLAAVFGAYDDEPAWDDFLSQYKNLMHSYVHLQSSERAVTFWAGGGAVRREAFVEVGGFDAIRYRHPSIEDIELGYRLARAGKKIKLNKHLCVKHLKRWTVRSLLRADILRRAIPWTQLIVETRHLPRDLNLTSEARVSAGLVGLLCVGCAMVLLQTMSLFRAATSRGILRGELAILAIVAVSILALNWDVYSFFAKKRGWWFAVRVVPVHWFYYLYSGAVFAVCGTVVLARLLATSLLPGSWGSRPASHSSRGR